jgi:hypothetical protein
MKKIDGEWSDTDDQKNGFFELLKTKFRILRAKSRLDPFDQTSSQEILSSPVRDGLIHHECRSFS